MQYLCMKFKLELQNYLVIMKIDNETLHQNYLRLLGMWRRMMKVHKCTF